MTGKVGRRSGAGESIRILIGDGTVQATSGNLGANAVAYGNIRCIANHRSIWSGDDAVAAGDGGKWTDRLQQSSGAAQ